MTINQLIYIILTITGINKDAVFSRCKKRELVKSRQFIHYFAYHNFENMSLSQIGNITSNTHGNVLYSIKKIDNYLYTRDKFVINDFYKIEKEIQIFIKFNNTVIFRDVSGIEQPEINLIEILKKVI